jgi:hypothetical protein
MLTLSEQNRLRLLELAVSLKFPVDTLLSTQPKPVQPLAEHSTYIPTCFKADIDRLRQAEGAAWGDTEIRLLADTLKEVGTAVSPDLKSFIA